MDSIPRSNELFWIETRAPGRLAILRRPASAASLQATIVDWLAAGIGTVVCLMEPSEMAELGLAAECDACGQAGLAFLAFPIRDFGVPTSVDEIAPALREIATAVRQGGSVGIHCQQSVGRSGLVTSCVLVALGFEPVEAFHVISKARGRPVPETTEQRRWIEAAKPALRALAL